MKSNMTIRYDKIGDILYIDQCLPYPEQESEEIGDEIIAGSSGFKGINV